MKILDFLIVAAGVITALRVWRTGARPRIFILLGVVLSVLAWAILLRPILEPASTRPNVFRPSSQPPDPGIPPKTALDAEIVATVKKSIFKVTGIACQRTQNGSGVLVAPELIITNAHVVAGETETYVIDSHGAERPATLILFDPIKDIAILRVTRLLGATLKTADATTGSVVGVFGFPSGEDLEISPARVGETINAIGTDIYGEGASERSVVVLATRLEPGDSGSAVVDESMRLVALAFAVDPASDTIAYALARDEIDSAIASVEQMENQKIDAGDCIQPE